MANGRYNLSRGGGGGASGGSFPGRGGDGERRNLRDQPNRRSRRYRDEPERYSPRPLNRPPVQRNQLPPPPPPRARGSRSQQLGRRAGGAWSTTAALPDQPPPQTGIGGRIEVRGGCSRGLREFCFSVSFNWLARFFISFSYSMGD